MITFAAQRAGHVLWPFVGATSALVLAAGCGWIGGMAMLATMVSTSLVAYAVICATAMFSGAVWRAQKG